MASITNNDCDGVTNRGLNFFKRYKDAFGNVVSAEMKGNKPRIEYELILINEDGEELRLENSCSAGYWGEGSRGTYEVLKMCGFNITENFIIENESFKLTK